MTMRTRLSLWTCLMGGIALIASCSSRGSAVDIPPVPQSGPGALSGHTGAQADHNRFLWSYHFIWINPSTNEYEVSPLRQAEGHWNVLKFLEQGPCYDCFKLVGVSPNPDGTLNVDISVRHPFPIPNLTGFDVRGIAMFNGTHEFPASGLVMSDRTAGEGEIINADGFTTLYNPTTVGHSFEGYMKGKLATVTAPSATLDGYKRFASDDPANTRNAFYAGQQIIVTYQVDMPDPPSPWVFGYAVDACWAPPISKPVDDPMTDFGPEANCPEAWKIDLTHEPIGSGLTDCGGQARLLVYVYDWQGKDEEHPVVIECPELFDGEVEATWTEDGVGFTRYEADVENAELAPPGIYRCLVSKEAEENDPSKPWLHISAYRVYELEVVAEIKEAPTAVAEASQPSAYVGETISFDASGSHDNDCGNQTVVKYEWDWDNDGTYDEEGIEVDHSWSTEATYHVQLRVTDDELQTDTLNEPLEVVILPDSGNLIWAKRVGGVLDDEGYGITKLSDNSTVTTGYFKGTVTFGQGEPGAIVVVSAGLADVFVARYNPDGTVAWAKRAGGISGDGGYAITTLSDNSTVVTGYFLGSATFGQGESNETVLNSAGNHDDVFIARYNPDGTLEWAKRAGGTGHDFGRAIARTSDDSTIVAGHFNESAVFGEGEPNETALVGAGGNDVFVAWYNPNGTLRWANRAGGTADDGAYGITMVSTDSPVVTGYFCDSAMFGQGEPNETALDSAGAYDIFMARYDPDGTLAWAKHAGGIADDMGAAVTALSDDSTAATGFFHGPATFGEGEPNETVLHSAPASSRTTFIARFNE